MRCMLRRMRCLCTIFHTRHSFLSSFYVLYCLPYSLRPIVAAAASGSPKEVHSAEEANELVSAGYQCMYYVCECECVCVANNVCNVVCVCVCTCVYVRIWVWVRVWVWLGYGCGCVGVQSPDVCHTCSPYYSIGSIFNYARHLHVALCLFAQTWM